MVFMAIAADASAVSDFASEVVDWQGDFYANDLYNDPCAMLGKPAVRCRNAATPFDPTPPFSFRVKLVEAAYYLSIDQQRVLTRIYAGEYITVKFDHKVMDYPGNPYGRDFIVFGNAFLGVSGNTEEKISDSSDMNQRRLTNPAGIIEEQAQVIVRVSQDGYVWHTFSPDDPNTPKVDSLFPTQAYLWDSQNAVWTDIEMDFTRPVDPNLSLNDFDGLTVADAIDLYNGSGGGASFDLRDLPDFNDLPVDPQTGCRWIQYIRFEVIGDPYTDVEIDAVSDVSICGDPTHPYPPGDINRDCRVNLLDLMTLSENWMVCTWNCGQ